MVLLSCQQHSSVNTSQQGFVSRCSIRCILKPKFKSSTDSEMPSDQGAARSNKNTNKFKLWVYALVLVYAFKHNASSKHGNASTRMQKFLNHVLLFLVDPLEQEQNLAFRVGSKVDGANLVPHLFEMLSSSGWQSSIISAMWMMLEESRKTVFRLARSANFDWFLMLHFLRVKK